MTQNETYRLAFTDPIGENLAGIATKGLVVQSPYVSYGLPYDISCAKHISETFHASAVYIIASGSLARETDRVKRLVKAIGEPKVAGTKEGFTPHTPFSEILQIAAECRNVKADCIVTLGGGSITDGAKLVVLALANNISDPEELSRYSVGSADQPAKVLPPTVPLITIPTTLSGGEYFSLAGGTNDVSHRKQGFLHSGMGSKLVILDPELCLLTPAYHWLSTGVRSLDHCVEALCCLTATAASDAKAEKGLRLLVPNLLKCKADSSDTNARLQCQLAVNLAMDNIRAGIPMGGSHAIGHQLGPLGVPHGVTSCILCPAVMKYNIKHGSNPEIARRQEKLRQILWLEATVAEVCLAAGLTFSSDLGDMLDAIIRKLGLPRTLADVQIGQEEIAGLSQRALGDFWAPTNPVPLLKAEQIAEILEAVR